MYRSYSNKIVFSFQGEGDEFANKKTINANLFYEKIRPLSEF